MFAVMASNVHWQWTPNGYVAAALGAGAAYILTDVVNELRAAWQKHLLAKRRTGQQRIE